MEISKRTRELRTENAFVVLKEVGELVAKGNKIVSFCIGEPDFDTPRHIKDCAVKAIDDGKTGYTPSPGIPELREAIAEAQSEYKGVDIKAEDVVVANGSKQFIGYSILSCTDCNKGNEVIFPNPGYPIYRSQIEAHGAVPVALNLLESKNFGFELDALREKVSDKTKLLIINTPQNPTGGVLAKDELEEIAKLAIKHDFFVFSDDIYSRIVYGKKFESIAAIDGMQERTIIADGLSKTYAMTGWRIGFAINKKLAPYFSTWVTNIEACAGHPNQYAALQAVSGPQDEAEEMRKKFHERRDLIVKGLNEIPGITCTNPRGAFYAYPNITEACRMTGAKDSEEFREKLLYEAGVAVLSDIHFGERIPGEGEHMRMSYATSNSNIKEGLNIIREFIEKNSK